jgi:hypothetical protein
VENNLTVDTGGSGNKEDKQSIIFFVVSLIFFLLILGIYIFFFLQRSNGPKTIEFVDVPRPDTEFFAIDPETEEIVKVEEEPVDQVITDLDFSDGFRPIGLVLKGYFDSIDLDQNILKFKNQLLKSKTLQLLDFDTTKIGDFYCWPTELPSSNGPVDIRTVDMGLSSKDARIYNPDEEVHPLEEINDYATDKTFVFMQLEDEYDIKQTNYIKKLILVGCLAEK